MNWTRPCLGSFLALALAAPVAAQEPSVTVTPDNFIRAETDMYFGAALKQAGGIGRFHHDRQSAPVDKQIVVRGNLDTLYSTGVWDLEAGPLTVELPDAKGRFRSMIVITEDQYTPAVHYDAGTYTFTREAIGTRYVLLGIRTLVDPRNPTDLAAAHALQDATRTAQESPGVFQVPHWDPASQKKVRDPLVMLYSTLPDQNRMFGTKEHVDPVRRLIGAAGGWGGNPETEAIYLNVTPEQNDGKTVYTLSVKDVPVDGFWSVSVYDAKGFFIDNPQRVYSLNNLTARTSPDGSVEIQFGGCERKTDNCIPTVQGWNYLVRLYRPRAQILDGSWKFPVAEAVE